MPIPGVFDKQIWPRAALGNAGAFNQEPFVPVANSQTINVGDFLTLSSGKVQQLIALPGSNNTGTLSGGNLAIYGIAGDSITTNSSGIDTSNPAGNKTTIPVIIFDANLELTMREWDATAANTPLTNLVLGQFYQVGRYRGSSASVWWYYMGLTTTNGELQYIEQYGINDQVGTDLYPLVIVRPNDSLTQAG